MSNLLAGIEPVEGDTYRHFRGSVPGGSWLHVRLLEVDAFGILGAPLIRGLQERLKSDRGKAAKGIERLLRTHRIINSHENVLSISLGCDRTGYPLITVVTEQGISQKPGRY